MSYQVKIPSCAFGGVGSIEKVKEVIKKEKSQKVVVSSDEGQMEWVESNRLSEINTVDDFEDLMRVINDPALTEFQYLVDGDTWTVSIK